MKKTLVFSFSFLAISGLFGFATSANAAENCASQYPKSINQSFTPFFDDSVNSAEYVNGLLRLHFKLIPRPSSDYFFHNIVFITDGCIDTATSPYTFNDDGQRASFTGGMAGFSVRFTSPTHYELWNDDTEEKLTCINCERDIPSVSSAYSVDVVIRGGLFASAFSGAYSIAEPQPTPPIKMSDLSAPANCPQFTVSGTFFDDYAVPEYQNGLLNYHFRLVGRRPGPDNWQTMFKLYDADCNFVKDIPVDLNAFLTYVDGYYRYFSFRFSSPTHFDIWNDETNAKETCPFCSVDLDFGVANIANARLQILTNYGGISGSGTFASTPFPVEETVEPEPLDPVIIIPGIAGSELYNGTDLIWPDLLEMTTDINDQFITQNLSLNTNGNSVTSITVGSIIERVPGVPIFDTNIFEGLRIALETTGYDLSKTLFLFPYDWRLNLDITKDLLNQKIEQIKTETGSSKVNIIAHSMGGLLVKDYIDQYGKNSINKLIFVGTPHLGAPKAAKILLKGDRLGVPVLEEDRVQEVAVNSPAVYELLPNSTYFSNFSGYITPFSIFTTQPFYTKSETKNYLLSQNLNQTVLNQAEIFFSKNLENLDFSGVDTYNIAGCKRDTQSAYQLNLFNSIGRIGYGSGDGTVPLGSADYIDIPAENKFYVEGTNHNELPSFEDVRGAIIQILAGQPVSSTNKLKSDSSFCGIAGKILVWRSPVDVHIYDSQNRHTGPLENNVMEYGIPDVDYEIIGHEKFIFLPTGGNEEYRIEGMGTDQGTFDLLVAENNDGEIIETKVFNDVPIDTQTNVGLSISSVSEDNKIVVTRENEEPKIVEASSILLGDQGNDITSPETVSTITGVSSLSGWYKSDIQIVLVPSDNDSSVLETKYSTDDGATFSSYISPVSISQEGTTTFKYFSVDKAGNNEGVKTLEIKIDKTAPEIKTYFDLPVKTFSFKANDNIDQHPTISCAQTQCSASDQAGNNTKLQFEKIKVLTLQTIVFKSVTYNGATQKLLENALIVNFEEKNGIVKIFNQTALLKKQEVSRVEYDPRKDQSSIYSIKKEGGFVKQVVQGKKFLWTETNKGTINTSIY